MKDNKKLEEWIEIATTIWKIYQDLVKDKIQNQEEKYQDDLEMLKMCIDLENKLYQSLEITIDSINQYYLQCEILINRTNLSQKEKEIILNRINRYLLTPEYLNPFLSMQTDDSKRKLENEFAIEVQYDIEYIKHFLSRIEYYFQIVTSKTQREKLIRCYYETLFESKISEHLFATPRVLKDFTLSERIKCARFNQNPLYINYYYQTRNKELLNDSINKILQQDFNPRSLVAWKVKLNIESLFSFSLKSESSNYLFQIYKKILSNPYYKENDTFKENLDFLTKAIREVSQKFINNPHNQTAKKKIFSQDHTKTNKNYT